MRTQPANATHAEAAPAVADVPLDALPSARDVHEAVRLASGRTVVVRGDGEGERVVVRAPDGAVELTVQLTAAGPVLRLSAVALELAAERLAVDVGRLEVRAREDVRVEAMGSVEARVLGDERAYVQGEARVEAGQVTLLAHRGDLRAEASEDVHIDGAAVRLNC